MSGGLGIPQLDFSTLGQAIAGLGQIGQRQEAQKLLEQQLDSALAAQQTPLGALGAPAQPQQPPLAQLGQPSRSLPAFAQAGGDMGGYLDTIRAKESGGNDLAKNPNSTATGRYQFTSGTWNQLAKSHPELGLTANGRTDPAQQERAIRVFTGQNAKVLSSAGIPINPQNLYGAHFLGAGGAKAFIPAAINNPDAPAASFVGRDVAAANRTVFFNKDGTPKTAGQVYAWMGGGGRGSVGNTQVARAPVETPVLPQGGAQMAMAGLPAPQMPGQAPMPPAPQQMAQADMPAPGAQPISGFAVPEGSGFTPGSVASPALVPMQSGGAPVSSGGLAPSATPRLSQAQADNLRAMLRNPITAPQAAKIIEGLNKPEEFSFQTVGDQLVRTSKSGRVEVVPNITKPASLQYIKGSDGNDYVFNPQTGQTTRATQGKDTRTRDLTPEEKAARGIPANEFAQMDAEGNVKFPGKAQTQVNIDNKAEKAQDVKIGTQYGDLFNASQSEGRNAAGQLNTLRLMEKLIENPNFYSGAGASAFVSAKRAAAALGVPGAQDAVAPNELFAKLASQSVLDKLGGNLGSGVSNADVSFITQTTANAANTPEGNRQIIQFGKALAQRQIDVAKLAREYAKANGGRLDSGFDERLAQWAEANPLFPEATAAQRAQQGVGGATPASASAPQGSPAAPAVPAVGDVRKGYRFKGGDPASPASWEAVQQGPVT